MTELPLVYGHFEVEKAPDGTPIRLGPGGMGTTFRAFDTHLRKQVALKVIAERLVASPASRRRFFNEARTVAGLDHPNIARVLYLSPEDAKVCFFAMELIEGQTLHELTATVGPFAPAPALRLLRPVVSALEYLSTRNLVHRDVKPENIMQAAGGREAQRIKLIDFGLAKAADDAVSMLEQQSESSNHFLGSTYFASPEQVRPRGALDGRSDFYSLGATLWYLLAGAPPFTGNVFQVHESHVYREPDWTGLPGLPAPTRRLLQTLLAKEPESRPANAADLAQLWDTVLAELTEGPMAATVVHETVPYVVPIAVTPPPPPAIPLRTAPTGSKLTWERAEAVPHGSSAPAGSGFLGRNRGSGEWFFIRPVPPALAPEVREHFLQVARQSAMIQHPFLRNVREATEQCVASEWRPGLTLAEVLRQHGQAFLPGEVFPWLKQWLPVLEFALAQKLEGLAVTPASCWLEFQDRAPGDPPPLARSPRDWGLFRFCFDPLAAFDPALEALAGGVSEPGPLRSGFGEATLLYHVAATLYRLLGGEEPPPGYAISPLPGLTAAQNKLLLEAIERTEPWRIALWAEALVTEEAPARPLVPPPPPRPAPAFLRPALAGLAAVLLIGFLVWAFPRSTTSNGALEAAATEPNPGTEVLPASETRTDPIVLKNVVAGPAPVAHQEEELPPHDSVNSLGMCFKKVWDASSQKFLEFSVWETRNGDLAAFWSATGRPDPSGQTRTGSSAQFPAGGVSWSEAREFCSWLTEKERKEGSLLAPKRYRLPTDHEWSCAVGIAGLTGEQPTVPVQQKNAQIFGEYPWGRAFPPPLRAGNFADLAAQKVNPNWNSIQKYDDGWAGVAPVGTFNANALGLFDLAGNVEEWCLDRTQTQTVAVLRGGSYKEYRRINLLSSFRHGREVTAHRPEVGFRVVRVSESTSPRTPVVEFTGAFSDAAKGPSASAGATTTMMPEPARWQP